MQVLTVWLLVALVLVSGVFAFAQGEIDLEYVYINNPFDDNFVCTSEEASAFYDALEDFPAQVEAIEDIDGPLKLMQWDRGFAQWFNKAEQSCYGTGNATVALERQARYIAIQHMTGEEVDLPEQNAYSRALEMAAADQELLTSDKPIAEDELVINLAVSDMPLCTVEQAMAFYATIDDFYVESIDLGLITDVESLKDWADAYYTWSEESWMPLLEEACGQMQSFINFLESFAFGTALSQLTIGGRQTLDTFDSIVEILYGWIGEEMAALEAYVDE